MLVLSLAAAFLLQQQKTPPPEKADHARLLKGVQGLFKEQYAKRDPEGRRALAATLMKQAAESADDPALRYVYWTEAIAVATEVGDVPSVVAAVGKIADHYDVEAVRLRLEALSALRKKAKDPPQFAALAVEYLWMAEEALDRDDHDSALETAREASAAARKAKDDATADTAGALMRDLPLIKQLFRDAQAAQEALAKDPEDPAAHLTLGRHLCFTKGQIKDGLPHLARGSDEGLKKVAALELANPKAAADRAAVGDAWSALAETAKDKPDKSLYQSRALEWYQRALRDLKGAEQLAIGARINELETALAGSAPGGTIDLIAQVDPRAHAVSGSWEKRGNALVMAKPTEFARVRFPILPRGGYELDLQFTRTEGNRSLAATLPVGDRATAVTLSWLDNGQTYAGLNMINKKRLAENETRRAGELELNRRYGLKVRVQPAAGQVAIDVRLNGQPYVSWKGPVSALSEDSRFAMGNPLSLGWLANESAVILHSARLEMLPGGRAEHLR